MMRKNAKGKRWLAALMAAALMFAITGCGEDKAGETPFMQQAAEAVQAQMAAVKSSERAAKRETENEGKKQDFGAKTAFKGIEIETDENGELVLVEEDGMIWVKITDKRFTTFKKLRQFVEKNISKAYYREISGYFAWKNGSMQFVYGSSGRTIESSKKYFFNDFDGKGGSKITLNVNHAAVCRRKYGYERSSVDFVKTGKKWKLDSVTLYVVS